MRFLILLLPVFSFCVEMDENLTSDYNATHIADTLNIAYHEYNFLMAFSGSLVGGAFLFGLVYLSLNLAKGR